MRELRELHFIRSAQNNIDLAQINKDFFARFLEGRFNVGAGAYTICDYIVENNMAYKLNTYEDVVKFLRDKYDVHPK